MGACHHAGREACWPGASCCNAHQHSCGRLMACRQHGALLPVPHGDELCAAACAAPPAAPSSGLGGWLCGAPQSPVPATRAGGIRGREGGKRSGMLDRVRPCKPGSGGATIALYCSQRPLLLRFNGFLVVCGSPIQRVSHFVRQKINVAILLLANAAGLRLYSAAAPLISGSQPLPSRLSQVW